MALDALGRGDMKVKRQPITADPLGPQGLAQVCGAATTSTRRARHALHMFLLATVLFCLGAPVARAAEADTHILNEALSLTGNCSTETLDSIPDPGCPGGLHPPGPFANPSDVSTDPAGDIYVASAGPKEPSGEYDPAGGRIDVFDASGNFLTELAVPGAQHIAVDATGHLYVGAWCGGARSCEGTRFLRFDPTKYDPATGEIEYADPPIELQPEEPSVSSHQVWGLAVNPVNQHLFVTYASEIAEFGPAIPNEPNLKIEAVVAVNNTVHLYSAAVDATDGLIYVSYAADATHSTVKAFELAPPHALVRTIDGSTTPAGKFISSFGILAVAAEEATGDVFVADIYQSNKVYEFEEDGSYVGTYKHGFESQIPGIHVDNSPASPNEGYLFVPSGSTPPGHVFAFQPKPEPHPPVVESISTTGLGEREAVVRATINPAGSATHYVFDYVTEESFDNEGFAAATIAKEGDLAAGIAGVEVSAALVGLSPGTSYRFRVRAESQCQPGGCSSEEGGSFTTFATPLQGGACGNASLRIGPSAALPDCRVYELVTPANTNGHPPVGPTSGASPNFGTAPIRADGSALTFRIEGGPIPGTNGTGGFGGDSYLATRTPSGWQIESQSPTGEQNASPSSGGLSPDLTYIGWQFGAESGAAEAAVYVRYPDGTFHLVGEGAPEEDPLPTVHYISPGGAHTIFSSNRQLTPAAPARPRPTVYDRTADGVLHVVSVLPGEITSPENARYAGRSDNGSSIAFSVVGALYVRVDNTETLEVSPTTATFAGFSVDGTYLFYVANGNFFRFDVRTQETVEVAGTGDVEPTNIPAQGTSAYFTSLKKITNEANPNGAKALAGHPNLYFWDGSGIRFVATLTLEDVEGAGGFDEWMQQIGDGALGDDPVRSDRSGSTLLFRSHAQLTGDDADAHADIYRYDASEGTLICVSCSHTGVPKDSDAKLTSSPKSFVLVANLSEDGGRAFFESSERLVPADNDGLQDVYEWEAEGKGSCRQEDGCLFLISSGQSGRPNFLFGVSGSGDDVAFSTSDLLTADDPDETASIYDARVEGGFPRAAAQSGECLGEACQPAAVAPPVVTPASSIFQGAGNVKKNEGCPKGKHHQRVHGKTRCVQRRRHHHRKQHKIPSHTQGRAAR